MQGKKITIDQGKEALDLLSRLSPEQYQERRAWLARISDPRFNPNMLRLFYPFKANQPFQWNCRGVEREGAVCEASVTIADLELVPFHKDGEKWISGEEMRTRAADEEAYPGCSGFGQHQAEDILERASELPEEFRKYVIVFADSVLLDGVCHRYVPFLAWDGGRWQLNWRWIDSSFERVCRFPRLRRE
ncbi:MAG: hypothetical protein R3B52_00210 [Candidatus Paceibacterota bacterium]